MESQKCEVPLKIGNQTPRNQEVDQLASSWFDYISLLFIFLSYLVLSQLSKHGINTPTIMLKKLLNNFNENSDFDSP